MPRLRRLQDSGVFVSVDNFAYVAANQGRFDDAFSLLEEALNQRVTNVLWLAVDPWAVRCGPIRVSIASSRGWVYSRSNNPRASGGVQAV